MTKDEQIREAFEEWRTAENCPNWFYGFDAFKAGYQANPDSEFLDKLQEQLETDRFWVVSKFHEIIQTWGIHRPDKCTKSLREAFRIYMEENKK